MKKTENVRIKVGTGNINSYMSTVKLVRVLANAFEMVKQVNYICKSCCYQKINTKLTSDEICKSLVQTLIISRLHTMIMGC